MLHGNNLIISYAGTVIAAAKSCEIDHSCEALERAATEYGNYRAYTEGRHTWKVTTNHLVKDAATMLMQVGDESTISCIDRTNNTKLTGTAICTLCKVTATRGNIVQGSFEFTGSGPLSTE